MPTVGGLVLNKTLTWMTISMLTLTKKTLEQRLHLKLRKDDTVSLGLDCATRTGWCVAKTIGKYVEFDYGFIDLTILEHDLRYERFIDAISSLVQSRIDLVVVEDCFFGHNVHTLKLLARLGVVAFTLAYQRHIPRTFLSAAQARKRLGFKGTEKKKLVQQAFLSRMEITLDDNDIVDAMILSLCGLTNLRME